MDCSLCTILSVFCKACVEQFLAPTIPTPFSFNKLINVKEYYAVGDEPLVAFETSEEKYFIGTSDVFNEFIKDIKKGVIPILLVLFLVFGLIMLQPDFGTGMIIVVSIIALLYIAGVNIKFFIGLGLIGIVGIILLIIVAPYRMDRITSFIDPWKDPLGTGFQIIQSLYAIGPGGLLGQGFLNSRQKHFYLPEPQTDFIFSIISEEFGIAGVLIVSSLFIFILYCGMKTALNSKNSFGKYLAFGMTFQMLIQTLMNLMVVIGLIPVTGVTLPFLSYGGSSLLISMVSIGIILNISKQNPIHEK